MNLDPFNEFPILRRRQEITFEYLKRVRPIIDSRVSDEDIMMLRDYGLDAVAFCAEKIKKIDSKQEE